MRAAKTELAAAERCWAKAHQNQPLRTSRGGYCTWGKSRACACGQWWGDVVEVFGMGGDLLKHASAGLDVSPVLCLR